MFGLSKKETLYNAIRTISESKLQDVKQDLRIFYNSVYSMSEEQREKEYCRIIGMHSNAVSATVGEKMGRNLMTKVGFAIQSPQITGLPEEFDLDYLLNSGPKVGFYFAFYYYALTGKQITLDDYGKYIRPLNKHQLDMLTGYLKTLESRESKYNNSTNVDVKYKSFVEQIISTFGLDKEIAEDTANIVYFSLSRNELYAKINSIKNKIIKKYGPLSLPLKFGGVIGILQGNSIITQQESEELRKSMQKEVTEFLKKKSETQKPYVNEQPFQKSTSEIDKLKLKATAGDSSSQNELGHKYYYGEGVQIDFTQAAKWYKLAAENGHCTAQFSLGVLYENGEGVSRNPAEAYKWYYEAAKQGDIDAKLAVGQCLYYGNGTEKDLTRAFKWYSEAAQEGNPEGQLMVGKMYYDGVLGKTDYKLAHYWLNKAAEKNNAEAMYYCGLCYETGAGVDPDIEAAKKWYTLAGDNGYNAAGERLEILELVSSNSPDIRDILNGLCIIQEDLEYERISFTYDESDPDIPHEHPSERLDQILDSLNEDACPPEELSVKQLFHLIKDLREMQSVYKIGVLSILTSRLEQFFIEKTKPYGTHLFDLLEKINSIKSELEFIIEDTDDLISEEEDFIDNLPEDSNLESIYDYSEEIEGNLNTTLEALNETLEAFKLVL